MYVVVGANGYLGSYVVKNILEKTNENVLALARHFDLWEDEKRVEWKHCDISCREEVDKAAEYIGTMEQVKVVYLSAYHLPDKVKENPKLAWDINITSLSYFLNRVETIKCLFYISTEMVYGEGDRNHLFKEEDALNPVNIYGKQKKVAEAIVTGYGYNVLRLPFMIGPSILSKKKHFYDYILETLEKHQPIEMFEDALKSALHFDTAAGVIVDLCENYMEDMPKIMNVAGDEVLSKYDIGLRIARANGLDENLVIPIKMCNDDKIFAEKRAGCTLLDNQKIKKVLQLSELKLRF